MADEERAGVPSQYKEKQRYEELQKKLKEEQEVKAELLRRAQDVLQSKKQLREMYNKEKEEKEILLEKIQNFQRTGMSEPRNEAEGRDWAEIKDFEGKIEKLKNENEEIRNKLKKQTVTEDASVVVDPELIAAMAELERLLQKLSELTEAKNDLQYIKESQGKTIETADDIPENLNNLYFTLSLDEAKSLAQKIKKLQVELWDLEISHQQLQVTHAQTLQDLENIRAGGINSIKSQARGAGVDIFREIPMDDEEELPKELEDERKQTQQYEYKYFNLVNSLITIKEQAKPGSGEQSGVVDTFYQLMQHLVDEKKVLLSPLLLSFLLMKKQIQIQKN